MTFGSGDRLAAPERERPFPGLNKLDEPLTATALAGGAAILAGVYLVSRPARLAESAAPA